MQRREATVKPIALVMLLAMPAAADAQERKYAPFSEYEMPGESEIALARSAAPERISARATIKVLTRNGYEVAIKGDNGFLCLVMRSWSAAPDQEATYYSRIRSPICFDPVAARTVAPVEELRTRLGLEGNSPRPSRMRSPFDMASDSYPKWRA